MAAKDRPLADAIARATAAIDRSLILFGLPKFRASRRRARRWSSRRRRGVRRSLVRTGRLADVAPAASCDRPRPRSRRRTRSPHGARRYRRRIRTGPSFRFMQKPSAFTATRLARRISSIDFEPASSGAACGAAYRSEPAAAFGRTEMSWWSSATPEARRALIAASLGWMLDAMDILIYSLVLNDVRREFGIDDRTSGILLALPLATSAFGRHDLRLDGGPHRTYPRADGFDPLVFGLYRGVRPVPDRLSARSLPRASWLRLRRRMGDWRRARRRNVAGRASRQGARLHAERVGSRVCRRGAGHGYRVPRWGWRAVFFAGVLPALVTIWIRAIGRGTQDLGASRGRRPIVFHLAALTRGELGRFTWLVAAMNAATMFAWWGLFTWIPSYLGRPVERRRSRPVDPADVDVDHPDAGWACGSATSPSALSPTRSAAARLYRVSADGCCRSCPSTARRASPRRSWSLGPLVAFFGTGYFSGFGAVSAELFPTSIRATAQGLTYNLGRGISALAPFIVGVACSVARAWASAFSITSTAFLVAALLWIWIPETKGTGAIVKRTRCCVPSARRDSPHPVVSSSRCIRRMTTPSITGIRR